MLNPKRYSVMRDAPQDVGLGLFPEGNPAEMQVSEADILAEMIRRANGIREPIQATAQVAPEPGPINSKPIVAAAPTVTAPELDKGPYPDRLDPNDPVGSMANAARARNYYIADSTHNAGNIGDFMSLVSRSVAGIGNVRGKMAETAVPDYMADLKKTAAARAEMMNNADDRYQKAMLSKELMDIKGKSAGEAGYKAKEAESRIALNNARAKGLITQSQYNQALQDPTSYESLMTRLAAAGLGMSTSEVVPGSAIQPLLKTMSGAYNTNLGYDAKLAQQASQREIQAAQARAAGERLDTQTATQRELQEQRLTAQREIDEQRRIAQKEINDARIAADLEKNKNTTGTAKEIAAGRNKSALEVAKAKAQAAKDLAAQRAKMGGGKAGVVGGGIDKIRQEYQRNPVVKETNSIISSWARLQKSFADPTPAGDLNLIYGYMKMLDPGSTVREGEFATAQNAGSAFQKIGAQYNKVISGQRLTKQQRQDFYNSAKGLYQGQLGALRNVNKQYKDLAKSRGLNTKDLLLQGEKKKIRLPSGFKGNRISYQGKPYVWNDSEKVYEEEE